MSRMKSTAPSGPPEGPAPAALAFVPTGDLLDELHRRSVGLLAVSVGVEQGNSDRWRYRLKGSEILLGALSAALACQTARYLEFLGARRTER